MAELAPVLRHKFTDANDEPLSGGKLWSYMAGTTTPLATYTDQSGLSANTNPIILDSSGECSLWLSAGSSYKFVLMNDADVVQYTVDTVRGSAVVSNNGFETLTVKNIFFNGNTISTLDTNGNLVLSPNGTGKVRVNTATASTVPYFNADKDLVSSAVTPTQLSYVDFTSSGQTQLDGKATPANITAHANTTTSVHGIADTAALATKAGLETLTNKTLTSPVVNSPTGIVKGDVGLGNVDNTSDATKNAASVTLTNKTLTSPVINTPTGIVKGDVGLGNVDNTSDATKNAASVTLTNKTLTAPIADTVVLDGQASTPASPSAGYYKIYAKDDGKVYKLNSSGTEAELGAASGGGGGSKNYLGTVNGVNGNGDFELGATTGWALGVTGALTNGLPTTTPTFGSGASANLSLVMGSLGNQISGNFSLGYTSSAATTAGNMVASSAFTIDVSDQAKVMTVKFNYKAAVGASTANWSGTSSNSFAWAIYSVSDSRWIIPTGAFGMTQSSGVGICTGTFQTSSSGTSYRLVVYNANATTGAVTVTVDDFTLGPQTAPIGYAGSDYMSFTPTGSWSTSTTYTGKWRRNGDMMDIQYLLTISGATTASALVVNLPSGYSIDTAKLLATSGNLGAMPSTSGTAFDAGINSWNLQTRYSSATAVSVMYSLGASQQAQVTQAAPTTWGAGDFIEINFSVPIAGWSSNVQMSSDTDTRVVAASFYKNGTQALASASGDNIITSWTQRQDTHGAWDSTNNKYVFPVSGTYRITGSFNSTPTSTSTQVFGYRIDGAATVYISTSAAASTVDRFSGSDEVSVSAGSSIQFVQNVGTGAATFQAGLANSRWAISRLSGPSVIAASDSVNASYSSSATTAIPISSALVAVVYATRNYDTHLSYNTATGEYTAPVSGKYRYTASYSTLAAVVNSYYIVVKKNGTIAAQHAIVRTAAITSYMQPMVNHTIQLNAGDILLPQMGADSAGQNLAGVTTMQFFSIEKVGNY